MTDKQMQEFDEMARRITFAMLTERLNNAQQEIDISDKWKALTSKEILFELYYHVGKLQRSLKDNDKGGVEENCGDIANYIGYLLFTYPNILWTNID